MRRCDRREWVGWGFVVAADGYPATAGLLKGQSGKGPIPVLSNPCSGGSIHGTTSCFRSDHCGHPSQLLALAIGAVYTLIGILGFLVTGFENPRCRDR